jgi:hypothetical protein
MLAWGGAGDRHPAVAAGVVPERRTSEPVLGDTADHVDDAVERGGGRRGTGPWQRRQPPPGTAVELHGGRGRGADAGIPAGDHDAASQACSSCVVERSRQGGAVVPGFVRGVVDVDARGRRPVRQVAAGDDDLAACDGRRHLGARRRERGTGLPSSAAPDDRERDQRQGKKIHRAGCAFVPPTD